MSDIVPDDLPPGWLRANEADYLTALARDLVVLEIGSFLGRSTVALARSAKLVVSVDHHRGSAEHQPGAPSFLAPLVDRIDPTRIDTAGHFIDQLTEHGVRDRVCAIIGAADVACPLLREESFDLVFIDGSHDVGSVERDLRHADRLVKQTGTIALHDFDYPDVAEAVTRFCNGTPFDLSTLVDSIVVLRPYVSHP
jgi:predicted O-methyltransferase YrrM